MEDLLVGITNHYGFMDLSAIIDLKTRYVVGWSVSNSMSAECKTEVMRAALYMHGKSEIFKTNHESQFTSKIFINELKIKENQISMDRKRRTLDNIFIEILWRSVKYENIYQNGTELYVGLNEYFKFYNNKGLHQSLGYQTPKKYITVRLKTRITFFDLFQRRSKSYY